MRVVIAPDSFKGSVTASRAAEILRLGWLDVRPDDEVVTLPLADGGEGTLDAMASASPGSRLMSTVVDGPTGPAEAPWLLLPDGTGVVELASACGLPLWPQPDPIGAHTFALGQVLQAAATHPEVDRVVVALGGSASTDGGTGALTALGAQFLLANGDRMPWGASGLGSLSRVDLSALVPPPVGGVEILSDVDATLLGPLGAARQFGPQKGATPADVAALEEGLSHLADILGGDPDQAGAGAAGGTAYGLATLWGATLTPGSARIADLVGLPAALDSADVVIAGEGRLDAQSFRGKVVGRVTELARDKGVRLLACVGLADAAAAARLDGCVALADLAGSTQDAMARTEHWLREAGRHLARSS